MPVASAAPETMDTANLYATVSLASRWLFVFFALMLLLFALAWHYSDRRERRKRFKNLPGAGTVGELVVLSGSEELPAGTWFPVPREGVLGSVRSCDLVVPCEDVRSQHLDFSWQDGTGLLIRPRLGCEVLVNGTPVARRGAFADTPMLHGSTLQVGTAVLQLQLFSALSHTNRPFSPQQPASGQEAWMPPSQPPAYPPNYPGQQYWQGPPDPNMASVPQQSPGPEPSPSDQLSPGEVLPDRVPEQQDEQPQSASPQASGRRRRPDQWKEDWSD